MAHDQGHFTLFGYPTGEEDRDTPLPLKEATVVGEAPVLRRLADFFIFAAEQLEKHGSDFGHEHFADFAGVRSAQQRTADIIVCRPVDRTS